jgi:4-alpha-glucanotransferase
MFVWVGIAVVVGIEVEVVWFAVFVHAVETVRLLSVERAQASTARLQFEGCISRIVRMVFPRSSGILLHPTSLPGPYGIGDMGPMARRFVDWLANAGQRYWQMLPLCPTGAGDSPYSSFSSFAANPLLLSPDFLAREGIVDEAALADLPQFDENYVDYGVVHEWKEGLLRQAWQGAARQTRGFSEVFKAFSQGQREWLEDYALFMALKREHGGAHWVDWPKPLAQREESALEEARERLSEEIAFHRFVQFLLSRQWQSLREYAHARGIYIIGDVPIYVAHDSADVWAHPHLFQLDENGEPTVVAGVPPDYFSETGQLWGNPIYRWDRMADNGYTWWVARLRAVLERVDVVRLDHFRGFAGYWEVPADEDTAVNGRWVSGPGDWIFDTFRYMFGADLPLIAEDLGVITDDVIELRQKFNLPGMQVLQFGLGTSAADSRPPYSYETNTIAYTGTHDNDTCVGWWDELLRDSDARERRAYVQDYLNTGDRGFNWACIRAVLNSPASVSVFPVQDILGLGSEARMNHPGTIGGNWRWRMGADALTDDLAAQLRRLVEIHGRIAEHSESAS